jgi:3-deoxy-D-manno-octulosonic-acid transferase
LRLVLAPRQPRRFQAVAELLRAGSEPFLQASGTWPDRPEPWAATGILLLDTLGELAAAYAEGTVALVGGGWAWEGGHNPLEPARWGVPTLIGPGFRNFEDLVLPLRAAGRLQVVPPEGLAGAVAAALAGAPLRPAAQPAPGLPESLAGALEKTWELITKIIPAAR